MLHSSMLSLIASTSTKTLPCCVFPVIMALYMCLLVKIQQEINSQGNKKGPLYNILYMYIVYVHGGFVVKA